MSQWHRNEIELYLYCSAVAFSRRRKPFSDLAARKHIPLAPRLCYNDVLGLHLERNRRELRLYDPATERRLPTPLERADNAEAARLQVEAENERLRHELLELRRRLPN